MNSVSCNVIQDLMPLYIEHMCSAESRKIVEKHMAECESCRQLFCAYTDETIVKKVSHTEAHTESDENEFHQILKNVESKVMKRVTVIATIVISFAVAIGIINFVPMFPASYEDAAVNVAVNEENDRIDIDTAQVRLQENEVEDTIVLKGRYSLAAKRDYKKSGQKYRYSKSLKNGKISKVIYRDADGMETILWER